MADTQERPVLAGLIALVAVAAVIGIIGGLAALVGSRSLGLNGDATASSTESATNDATLYLPKPTITSETVVPETSTSPTVVPVEPSSTPATKITLSVAQQSVGVMQQIDLTGTYATGEGATLQVQNFQDGAWSDFPVTMLVSNGTFTGYVETSQVGENKFRVIDVDKDVFSNEVAVTVG